MGKNVSFTQKWVKNLVKFPGSEKIFKNILKVLKRIKKVSFAKMGKNVSFTLFLLSSGMTLTTERGQIWPRQYKAL